MKSFCGIHAGRTMLSESTTASIYFSSNNLIQNRGFRIRIEVVRSKCLFKYRNITQGVIRTPRYPNKYRKEETCIWEITVNEGKFVKLTFDETFNINTSSKICGEDYLLISRSGDLDNDVHRFGITFQIIKNSDYCYVRQL